VPILSLFARNFLGVLLALVAIAVMFWLLYSYPALVLLLALILLGAPKLSSLRRSTKGRRPPPATNGSTGAL